MEVCNRIDDRLWQVGARHWPNEVPMVDIVISAYEDVPAIDVPLVLIPFGDHDHVELDPGIFAALQGFAEGVKDLCVMTVCAEGKNRSGLMSALILHARGMRIDDAIFTVKEKASKPGTVGALSNSMFIKALRSLNNA